MKAAARLILHGFGGAAMALFSTFVGQRSAIAFYADIMGCETGCKVVATGWPFIFVTDYLGISVANTANIMEVWFAADRFAWAPFLLNTAVWAAVSLVVTRFAAQWWRRVISKTSR